MARRRRLGGADHSDSATGVPPSPAWQQPSPALGVFQIRIRLAERVAVRRHNGRPAAQLTSEHAPPN
jgi:hypothetical protein